MVKWTPKAEVDLELIMEHISENFNIDLAVETIYKMVDYVESTLSKNPLAGMLLESNPFFSVLIYDGNSIYYCENPRDRNIYIVYVRPRGTEVDKNRLRGEEVA